MSWDAVIEAGMGIRVVGGAVSNLETTAASFSITRVVALSGSILSGAGYALSPTVPS